MDRRTRLLFATLLAAIVVATAIAAAVLTERSGDGARPDMEQMTGVVVSIDGASLGDIRGFVLRQPGGELVEFGLADQQNGAEFPPGHLAEHQATAEPIRVWFREEGDSRMAIRLKDAVD